MQLSDHPHLRFSPIGPDLWGDSDMPKELKVLNKEGEVAKDSAALLQVMCEHFEVYKKLSELPELDEFIELRVHQAPYIVLENSWAADCEKLQQIGREQWPLLIVTKAEYFDAALPFSLPGFWHAHPVTPKHCWQVLRSFLQQNIPLILQLPALFLQERFAAEFSWGASSWQQKIGEASDQESCALVFSNVNAHLISELDEVVKLLPIQIDIHVLESFAPAPQTTLMNYKYVIAVEPDQLDRQTIHSGANPCTQFSELVGPMAAWLRSHVGLGHVQSCLIHKPGAALQVSDIMALLRKIFSV